jgi:PAS domain S-box-containing protein
MKKSLKHSEELFKKAFLTSPDSISISRLSDGAYVSINPGFTKITGYTEEETIGKTSLELNIWVDPAGRDRLVNGLKDSGRVENMETRFLMKDGTIRTGMMSATIIEIDGIPSILSIIRDITEKKIAELAIQESENRFRELIELAVDGILLGASDGTIIGANTYMLNLTGKTLDQLLGSNISLLFSSDALKKAPFRYDLLQQGNTVITERQIIGHDGRLVPVEMHTKMMPDGSYQSIFHDISDRKAAEKALRESEEWFRLLFEQSTDGILYLTLDGNILNFNKSFAEMHGYSPEEIRKMNIEDLDCPESGQFYNDRIRRLIAGENLLFEVEHFHKDGHRIPLEVTAQLITLDSGKYIMSSHRDISQRLKAEDAIRIARDKAEASDRLKTSFLNNISHEVRTPLNGILGFADLIIKNDLTEEEKEEALSMVYESSHRLLETITNYMDRSLLVSGQMTVTRTRFSPESCLKDLFKKFETECSLKKIDLILDMPFSPDIIEIYSDPEHFRKILNHLLNNAIKFTEEGKIQFGYTKSENVIEFYVLDTGIGIGQESIKMIFEQFTKEEIKTRPSEGSGLGLSISKDLVGLLGGELRVESEKGKGSRFSFTLQDVIVKEKKHMQSVSEKIRQTPGISEILIAEDDQANFMYIKTLLQKSISAKIIHAANGREAIEKFMNNPGISLVLMDIKMPEVDGIEATKTIKSYNPAIPVIAITAYAMLGDEKKIMEAGFDGYLSKPLNRKTLLGKIAELTKS